MIEETTIKGEVYFIGEKEIGGGGNHTGYFKIGMVGKEGMTEERRLNEHQTGNPRELFIHKKIDTLEPFWVESSLHQRYGKKRARAEWHAFNPEELEEVIAEAQTLADKVETHYQCIRDQETLQNKESNGNSRRADQDFLKWFIAVCCAHWAESKLVTYKNWYTGEFTAYEKAGRPSIDEEPQESKVPLVTGSRTSKIFDKEKFKDAYPEIYSRFMESTRVLKKTFQIKYSNYEKLSQGFSDDKEENKRDIESQTKSTYEFLGDFCSRFEKRSNEVKGNPKKFRELDDLYFELKGWISICTWDKKVAEAHMACFCGEFNAVIDEYGNNLLTWKREWKESKKLNQSELKEAYPEEYEKFVTEKRSEVTRENKS